MKVNKIRTEMSIKLFNKALNYRYQNQPELKEIKKRLLTRQINYSEMYDLRAIAQDNKELDELEKNRWNRQITNTILNQKRIKNARVVVFGCGGVGSNVLIGLSYAGVYNFKIIDFDKVELSNLNQQTLYHPKDIGKFKVDKAQERLVQINPEIRVETFNLKLNYPIELNLLEMDENKYPDDFKKIDKLIKWGDHIVSASDYFGAPYLINDLCVKNQKPYYWGGCNYFLSDIFSYYPKEKTACIRCLFGPTDFTDETQHFRYNKPNSVYKAINFGTTNILTGIFIAENIIKDICEIENKIHGRYTIYDGYDKELYKIPINTNDKCKCLLYR